MNERVKKLTEEAAKLSPAERAELVEGIMASFGKPDADIERAWVAEAMDRSAAYERGEIATVDFDDMLAKHRSSTTPK